MHHHHHRLNPWAFGLASGLVWAFSVLAAGLGSLPSAGGHWLPFVNALSTVYIGYGSSIGGSVIGALWGFIDAFIGGTILIWLYNLFATCCSKKNVED